jgi:hypothetical protein
MNEFLWTEIPQYRGMYASLSPLAAFEQRTAVEHLVTTLVTTLRPKRPYHLRSELRTAVARHLFEARP